MDIQFRNALLLKYGWSGRWANTRLKGIDPHFPTEYTSKCIEHEYIHVPYFLENETQERCACLQNISQHLSQFKLMEDCNFENIKTVHSRWGTVWMIVHRVAPPYWARSEVCEHLDNTWPNARHACHLISLHSLCLIDFIYLEIRWDTTLYWGLSKLKCFTEWHPYAIIRIDEFIDSLGDKNIFST